ncbi:alpha/beta hydrolase [Aquibacillus rhizosphaerae]|uniref:Alpha/beta hydrolase n=1 Tax=Aquibacillus rhizosphaerae TaxID=3051431 RepID=A0ABT7LA04_9BACI|nr:alpha/beta hydrolase [Aquibacillus sp. LR5S19]MDL4842077.1 alpha/beta hydrolase [Aquibacillus sp. LR5S19]
MVNPLQKETSLSSLNTRPKSSVTRSISTILLFANILSIILSGFYLIGLHGYGLWNIFGVLFVLTLIGNIIVAAFPSDHKWLDYSYLLFTIIAMILLPVLNSLASFQLSNTDSRTALSVIIIFILLILGTVMAAMTRKSQGDNPFTNRFTVHFAKERMFSKRRVMTGIWSLFLLGGVYVAYELLQGKSGGVIEMFFPGYALFFSIGTIAIVLFIIKMHSGKSRSLLIHLLTLIGLGVAVCFSLPLFATLFSMEEAETRFTDALGDEWKESIPEEVKTHFLTTPFSLPNYFFGTETNGYTVQEDILFFEGEEGIDKDIQLRFDAYLPPEQTNLPGNRSVLIRIHGGGWTIGDKGSGNNAQINKYFASQGYVVFDVQYGLSSEEKFVEFAPVPDNIVADFTIDDMVRHIGLFTDYLVENNDQFNADLNAVFISGASAGGQLANAVGLGLASGEYEDILNPELHVKGIIPLYPANGLADEVGIDGSDALTNPAELVTGNSPPSLIFQGTADGVVDASISKTFAETYKENNNPQSVLLMMPYAGHNGDFYFSSYYNQMFIYYMERFMYLN